MSSEAIYCKQHVKDNYHNLHSSAGIHSLLLTQINTKLEAVNGVAINKNNQIIGFLKYLFFSFNVFGAGEQEVMCGRCCGHLDLWPVYLLI